MNSILFTNPQIKKIFYSQLFFFMILSLLLIFFENAIYSFNKNFYLLCFILIATIGISHGALDHIKGKFILKKTFPKKSLLLFYMFYILFALLVLFSWIKFSFLSLIIFFIISSFHFGQEDVSFFMRKHSVLDNLFYFMRGLIVISSSFYFNQEETQSFIKILIVENADSLIIKINWFYCFWVNVIILFLFVFFYFFKKKINWECFLIMNLEILFILIIFYFLPLFLAFTLYFCFMHSTKHILSLSYELNNKNINLGLKKFAVSSLPLTIITFAIALLMLVYLKNEFSIDKSIIKITFVGLASLTLPHIILDEIYDKYKQ